jgi:ADP-ribose pyrophosphatase YjhB (NUDIX family)
MAVFDKEKAHFNYRVAGVAIHNGHILLDRNSRNKYWVLPGGHPEMMEPMAEALRREISEEISADVEVVRLLWIMENFFHKSKDIHELSFYFLMQIDPQSPLLKSHGPFYGVEHEHRLYYQWFPLDEVVLSGLPLYPGYLPHALLNIPDSPQHIVFSDINQTKESTKSNEITKSSPTQRLTIP